MLYCGSHSESLRDSLATVAYWLCDTITSCDDVHVLFASFLIALDKCLGIRPIRIGKVSSDRKAICMINRSDIEDVCGIYQLSTGLLG